MVSQSTHSSTTAINKSRNIIEECGGGIVGQVLIAIVSGYLSQPTITQFSRKQSEDPLRIRIRVGVFESLFEHVQKKI